MASQSKRSAACSKAHNGMAARGQHTTDDSTGSEKRLITAAMNVKAALEAQGHSVEFKTKIEYWDIKHHYHTVTGAPAPTDEDRRISIKPDGGVFIVDGKVVGIFEDKFEGTADLPQNKEKGWSGGSTIDRTAKNLNVLKMYCTGSGVFPYVVFAHGCNFHPKLTVYKRLEGMNHGYPCDTLICEPGKNLDSEFESMVDRITPESVRPRGPKGLEVATILIKTHAARGDQAMDHGASDWTVAEYQRIIEKTVQAALPTEEEISAATLLKLV